MPSCECPALSRALHAVSLTWKASLIRFTEALTHGAIPWTREDSSRRTLFYKFSPHGTSWSSTYYNEEDYEIYEDLTDRQRAILKPPSAHTWSPKANAGTRETRTPQKDGVGEMARSPAAKI